MTVEEVTRGKGLVRFAEVPRVLHGDDPRFVPPIQAWERFRLSKYRNPYVAEAEVGRFLARRGGRVVGRVAAHVAPEAPLEGRFGFWSSGGDPEVASALLDAARTWLAEQECTSMTGPWSFRPEDEPGLLVRGHEVPGTTGRPWTPADEAEALVTALGSAVVVAETASWRLATTEVEPVLPLAEARPGQAGSYVDPRLVLEGIAAVPDVADALRASRLGGAWRLAAQARDRDWAGATVVSCTADPQIAVPALQGAAGRAGYAWVVAPWSPDPDAAPETVHRTYRVELPVGS